jgi:hypothetical protein
MYEKYTPKQRALCKMAYSVEKLVLIDKTFTKTVVL